MFSEITKMTIAVIAQSGSRFWSRHILSKWIWRKTSEHKLYWDIFIGCKNET